MNLQKFFLAEHVINLNSAEKQPAIRELVSGLQDAGLIENKDRFYAQVAHRESLENTGIGNMLAIPHARSDSVEKFCTILGICDTPVDYQSFDGKPVKYIMLSLFPTEYSTKYLYLIGMMARIFNSRDNSAFLEKSHTPEEVYAYLPESSRLYKTIHAEKWPEVKDDNIDLALEAKWNRMLDIKEKVNNTLEKSKTAGTIGHSLDAHCTLNVSDEKLYVLLDEQRDMLERFFIVSKVSLEKVEKTENEEGLDMLVEHAKGEKCQRCWNYDEETGKDEKYPDTCPRCAAILEKHYPDLEG